MHLNKYLVELIGTFFLVFTIGIAVIEPGSAGDFAPVAIGSVLMAMIYAGGHISGAHYNPAVTVAFVVRDRFETKDVVPYLLAQLFAAAAAAGAVMYLKGPEVVVQPSDLAANLPQVMLAEILFTFALVFVILNVATARGTEGNSYYGLAIAVTVVAGAYAVGGISGAVFNPAVAVGISIMGLSTWNNIWIYLVANLVGAVIAALMFRVVHGPDEVG
jgi:aquaporin Z